MIKSDKDKIINALRIACDYGQIDGSHHKMWVIDQMIRALCDDEDRYNQMIDTFAGSRSSWDTGIAP